MSIFDIFSDKPAQEAADAQKAGLNAGYNQASGNINNAISGLNTNYAAALQPFMTNFGQAQGGVTQLQNLLGINGAAGSQTAMQSLENTPGYQFQMQQGNAAINAADAANGTLHSGNQMLDLSKFNQGLAGTTYQSAVSNLMPFLGASNSAAGGIANVNTGLGNAQAGQQDMLAQLGYSTQTGIGNANANADLAKYNASGNIWNMLGSIGGMGTSGGGTVGGNAMSSMGSAASSGLSSIMAMFSDERLKENIEPVGELYDGSNVYRYNYLGDPTPRIGLMAQEVEQTRPDAVVEIGGFKAVDYGKATQAAARMAQFLEAA